MVLAILWWVFVQGFLIHILHFRQAQELADKKGSQVENLVVCIFSCECIIHVSGLNIIL